MTIQKLTFSDVLSNYEKIANLSPERDLRDGKKPEKNCSDIKLMNGVIACKMTKDKYWLNRNSLL